MCVAFSVDNTSVKMDKRNSIKGRIHYWWKTLMQHVKDEIGDRFSGALAGSGFNVEDLVVDLDFYITGLTMVQNVKTN